MWSGSATSDVGEERNSPYYYQGGNNSNYGECDEVFVCPICLLTFPVDQLFEFAQHISYPGHDIKQITSLKRDEYYHCPKCSCKGADVYGLLRHWQEGGAAHHGAKILKKIRRKVSGGGGGQVAAAAAQAAATLNRKRMSSIGSYVASTGFVTPADNATPINLTRRSTLANSIQHTGFPDVPNLVKKYSVDAGGGNKSLSRKGNRHFSLGNNPQQQMDNQQFGDNRSQMSFDHNKLKQLQNQLVVLAVAQQQQKQQRINVSNATTTPTSNIIMDSASSCASTSSIKNQGLTYNVADKGISSSETHSSLPFTQSPLNIYSHHHHPLSMNFFSDNIASSQNILYNKSQSSFDNYKKTSHIVSDAESQLCESLAAALDSFKGGENITLNIQSSRSNDFLGDNIVQDSFCSNNSIYNNTDSSLVDIMQTKFINDVNLDTVVVPVQLNVQVIWVDGITEAHEAINILRSCHIVGIACLKKEGIDEPIEILQIGMRKNADNFICYVFDCISLGKNGMAIIAPILTDRGILKICHDVRMIEWSLRTQHSILLREVVDVQLAYDYFLCNPHNTLDDVLHWSCQSINITAIGDIDKIHNSIVEEYYINRIKDKKEDISWMSAIKGLRNEACNYNTEKLRIIRQPVDVLQAFISLLPKFSDDVIQILYGSTEIRLTENIYDISSRHKVKFCSFKSWKMCNYELYNYLKHEYEDVTASSAQKQLNSTFSSFTSLYGEQDGKSIHHYQCANVSLPITNTGICLPDNMDILIDLLPIKYQKILLQFPPNKLNRIVSIEFQVNNVPILYFDRKLLSNAEYLTPSGKNEDISIYIMHSTDICELFKRLICATEDNSEWVQEDEAYYDRMKSKLKLIIDGYSECIPNTLHTWRVYQKDTAIEQIIIKVGRNILGNTEIIQDLLHGSICRQNIEIKTPSILVIGRQGSGKTTVTREIIRQLVSNGISTCIIDCTGEYQAKHPSIGGSTCFFLGSHSSNNSFSQFISNTDFSNFSTVIIDNLTTHDDVTTLKSLKNRGNRIIATLTGDLHHIRECAEFKDTLGLGSKINKTNLLSQNSVAHEEENFFLENFDKYSSLLFSLLSVEDGSNMLFDCIIELSFDDFNKWHVVTDIPRMFQCLTNSTPYPLQVRQRSHEMKELWVSLTDSALVGSFPPLPVVGGGGNSPSASFTATNTATYSMQRR